MLKLADKGTSFNQGFINGKLDDPELQDLLWSYKRRVAGNYRPLSPEEIGVLPTSRYLISEKIDGELWFLVVSEGASSLVNPYGRVIHGDLPLLSGIPSLPEGTIFAGELYVAKEGARARVGDLSAFFADSLPPEGELRFCVFDVVRGSDSIDKEPYGTRYSHIETLLGTSKTVHPVSNSEVESSTEISSLFAEKVLSGKAEGLIVRLASGLIYKIKPVIEIDAVVIAYTSRLDSLEQARSVLLALAVDDATYQVVGGCGNLGSDNSRTSLLKQLEPLVCDSSVRISSDTGGLYKFVRPSLVVQIKVTDLQTERSDGGLSLGHQVKLGKKGWTSLGMFPTGRLIHPVLIRLRDDKNVNAHDIRASQLDDYVHLPKATSDSEKVSAKSEVLRREVWVKETKGVKAVRKLIMWKTNKETFNPSMPGFVIHWTDYSPGRASPLDREVKVAPTLELASTIADQLVEANIKKGWEKL